MKKYYTLFCLICLFAGCSDQALKQLEQKSKKADKAAIVFNGKNGNDSVVHWLNKKAAQDIVKAISRKRAPNYSCQQDGNLVFYEGDSSFFHMDFTIDPACSHVAFRLEGYAYSKILEESGIQKLKNYQKKASVP